MEGLARIDGLRVAFELNAHDRGCIRQCGTTLAFDAAGYEAARQAVRALVTELLTPRSP